MAVLATSARPSPKGQWTSDARSAASIDSLHDEAVADHLSFDQVRTEFYKQGCVALGSRCSAGTADPMVAEVYALLGDDIDGAACALEDMGL